jgi:hypothetical protein
MNKLGRHPFEDISCYIAKLFQVFTICIHKWKNNDPWGRANFYPGLLFEETYGRHSLEDVSCLISKL